MAEFPYLPLFTDAYLGDTIHLTTIEHGAYLLLLMTAWRSKGCVLPDDDARLARYARLTPRQWARIRPTLAEFFTIENGIWSNGRLLDEHAAVRRQLQQRSDAGRASALKRKNRDATGVQRGGNGASTPTPTPIEEPTGPPFQGGGPVGSVSKEEPWRLSDEAVQTKLARLRKEFGNE